MANERETRPSGTGSRENVLEEALRRQLRPPDETTKARSVGRVVSPYDEFRESADRKVEKANECEKKEKSVWRTVLNYTVTILVSVLIALLINRFVLQRNTVVGTSMVPTLQDHDELLVEKISHLWRPYQRGDIITANTHERTDEGREQIVIKRVIGLPGEHVMVRDGDVYIDGSRLDEPYLTETGITQAHNVTFNDLVLGDDEYYLMGDNRVWSRDSRDIGPIHRNQIIGKVLIRILPIKQFGKP